MYKTAPRVFLQYAEIKTHIEGSKHHNAGKFKRACEAKQLTQTNLFFCVDIVDRVPSSTNA